MGKNELIVTQRAKKTLLFISAAIRVFCLTLAATFLTTFPVFAQGLNIPSGSSFNVNNNTVNVAGDVTNAGTLLVTTGLITLTGSWTNSGTFTAGTGTVNFNGASGTQTIITGGLAQAFYNLTHSGASTALLSTNPVDVNNDFVNNAGTFNAAAVNMTVANDWTNTAAFTPGTGTVTFDGTNQAISGSTSFYTFVKQVAAADTLTFDNTGSQTISRSLTLKGAAANLLSLRSDSATVQWDISLLPGGVQSISYVDVQDSNALGGVTLVAGTTSTDSGNNINWSFGAVTLTWDGSASSDWDDPFNWDLGIVPSPSDSVVIPSAPANQPVLSTDVTVVNLTINAGASLTLSGNDITVSTAFSNSGNVNLQGTETVSLTQDTDSGTFTYVGNGDGVVDNRTIIDFGATDYFNLVINDPNATKDIFQTNAVLTLGNNLTVTAGTFNSATNSNNVAVGGAMTVNGGTLTATTSNVDVNGSVVVSSGTLTAPTGGQTFTVAGNFTHSGGTFTPGTGTLTLDGTNQALSGSTTFYALTKSVTTAATLTLDNTATQTVTNTLTLTGAVGQQLSIVSDSLGNAANLTLQAGGLQTISHVNVRDNDASGGITLVAFGTSTDSGNNTNWQFGGATVTWDGSTSTDWNTASNWDLGYVPTVADDVIIAPAVNQPVLASNVSVDDLTLQNATTLTANGFNLAAAGTFFNDGNVILRGVETVTLTQDTNSGTFTYVGNADGVVDTRTIIDFGVTDYYNLVINDPNATKDIFQTNAALTLGNGLTVTAGTFNSATNSNAVTMAGAMTVNGGTLTATTSNVDVNGAVVISSGTLTAPTGGQTFTVAGNFTHSGGTFTPGTGTLTLDGTNQTLNGSTTFYGLNKTVTTAAALTFDNTANQTVTNSLTLSGAAGQLLSLVSDSPGNAANLTLQAGGTQSINYVDVIDNDASGGLLLVARNASVDSGNNTNWAFGAVTLTWDGSTSTDWNTGSNWDLGLVPIAGDSVVIAAAANQPVLASNVSVADLTLQGSTTLTLGGYNLTATGTFSNDGNVILQGVETVTLTQDTNSGTFTYVGNGDGVVNTRTIIDFGATDYFNLVINDPNATKDLFQTNGNLTVGNNLTLTTTVLDISTNGNTLTTGSGGTLSVAGGTLTATLGDIDANGSVAITSGTLTAPNASNTFNIAGNFTNTGGTFANSSGEVIFDDNTQTTTITGNTTFFNFEVTTPGKTILFTPASTQTVQGTFNIFGAPANKVVLNSASSGSSWNIDFPNGPQSVFALNVQDSNALSNTVTVLTGTNGGNNNANWLFTNFQIIVPAAGRTVGPQPVIIGVAPPNQNITIQDATNNILATVTSDANGNFRVKVGDDLANLGTVNLTSLPVGGASLTPYFGIIPGDTNGIIVVASPTTSQVPTILTPANNSRLSTQTPTLTGVGKASSGITIYANDANGNLLLQIIGSDTVTAGGSYAVTATTNLAKGRNYLSVVVDGVSSEINTYLLTDPYGYVFDSVTNALINGAVITVFRQDGTLAVPGVDLDSTDINPYTTGTDGFYSFMAANGNYYMTVTAQGFGYPSALTSFPGGRTITTGSKGEVFTVNNVIRQIDHPVDGTPALFRIEKIANKKEARVGDVVTYTVTIENTSTQNTITDTFLNDKIPPGFKYLSERVLLDGVPTSEPSGQRPLVFNIGTFTPGTTKTLRYQLVVGAGVGMGNYENAALAKYTNGLIISNRATATVKVGVDPLFDSGTVIGKVFWDLNENGRQDSPEYDEPQLKTVTEQPVPNVQLVMEDGTVVATDKNGQFSLPGLMPGRHLLRVDERSLPPGSYLTTDKVAIIDITQGMMVKVNFGVNSDRDQPVTEDEKFFNERIGVFQNQQAPVPRLNIDLFNGEIRLFNNSLIEPAEFRIFLNYTPFVDSWVLQVIDRDTKKLVKNFEGTRFDILAPVYWDGRGDDGQMIRDDRNYSYVLTLKDSAGALNMTQEKPITLREIPDEIALKAEREKEKPEEYAKRYQEWLDAADQVNITQFSGMRIDGETVRIDPKSTPVRLVRIIKDGQPYAEIPVARSRSTTAADLAQGVFEEKSRTVEFILPKGEYDLQVVSSKGTSGAATAFADAGPSGGDAASGTGPSSSETAKHSRKLKVGDDYLMFVAMGDGQVGYNFDQGNIEPLESSDGFDKGFYKQGKMAYFLKGKIKGKYLVTSSFDSEREKKELFRTLDRETYYPVYGDQSSANYSATNTQGPLYLLVEWDRSSAIWGNYAIDWNDTEFAQFSRSYYGGKIDYESLAQTPFSEPRTKIAVFNAQIKQRTAHNEMLGTGGSLYYLKHKDIVEGSDRVRVEVRDQVTGLSVSSREMTEGVDYELDYSQGRILFWQPVSMLASTDRVIGNNVLQGNPVYVVTDYEYATIDKLSEASQGARVAQAVTDNLTTGVTYVRETQSDKDYELTGVDTTLKITKDATVKAEYAETRAQDTGSFISTDGGLSFTELSVGQTATGKAYGISGDARLFNSVGLQSYYKWIQDGFSTASTSSQQGKELAGFAMTWDMTPETRLTMRQDIQKLMTNANLQAQLQVGAEETRTSAMQIMHDAGRLRLAAELQNQAVVSKNQFDTVSDSDTTTLAARADYALTPKTDVSLTHEAQLSGEKGQQTTVGASTQLTDRLTVRGTQSFGDRGVANSIGATANTTGKLAIATDYTQATDSRGIKTDTTTVGATAQVTEKIALNSTVARSTSSDGKVTLSTAVGTQASTDLGSDGTDVNVAVGVSQANTGESIQSASVGAAKQVDDQTAVSTSVTVSQDEASIPTTTMSLGAAKKVDDKSTSTAILTVDQTAGVPAASTFTIADSRKLNDEFEALVERSIGSSQTELRQANKYALIRDRNGRRLEGSLTRQFAEGPTEISQSNIFGLSGDINDRWALLGSLQRGTVQNLDGTSTQRTAVSTGVGYVNKDIETGETMLKSSTKFEVRLDSGDSDKRQFVLYNANEGKITDAATIFTKFEYSKTEDTASSEKLAGYKEIVLGTAYRPISNDRLNFIAKYTYQENKSPAGQVDTATIDKQRAHVFSAEAIYDINERWQLAEKFAYRINAEKVVGFEFNKTHTWLMVHRVNYSIDRNWQIGSEYRRLAQVEAKDSKSGFLLEASRKINDFAKLGVGYNFTTFNDDLTNLSYTAQGPFLRVTGSAYDRTPEERQRARARWLEERISKWAWKMVYNELKRPESEIVRELNVLYVLADIAAKKGQFDESKELYKSIVTAGQMMFEEASQFIREQIAFEEKMKQLTLDADEALRGGELEKARNLWQSVVDQAQIAVESRAKD